MSEPRLLRSKASVNSPFTIQTVPEEVKLEELIRKNGTRCTDARPHCKTCSTHKIPGFNHIGTGMESIVFDAREFVIKLPRPDAYDYKYVPGTRFQHELVQLCEKYPDRFAETRFGTIIDANGKEIPVLYQEKLVVPVPKHVEYVNNGYEYGYAKRDGKVRIFDWG